MARGSRTALITGSGRNMGRGCAKELARADFNIVINGSSKKADCDRVADEVREIGTDAQIEMADIGDKAAVETMAANALKTFGRVDVLINNAAIRPGEPGPGPLSRPGKGCRSAACRWQPASSRR